MRQGRPQQTRPRPRPPRPGRRDLPHQDNPPRRRRRLRRRTLRRPRPQHEHHHQSPQQRRVPPPHAAGQRETRPTKTPGERIGTPTDIASNATGNNAWSETRINRYGRTITARTTEITGLWFGVWRTDPVRVILVKDSRRKTTNKRSYDIAIVTTDMTATAAEIIARYASRWSIEVCFHDGKNITGVGETQNRVKKAVERSVPFTFMCQTITQGPGKVGGQGCDLRVCGRVTGVAAVTGVAQEAEMGGV